MDENNIVDVYIDIYRRTRQGVDKVEAECRMLREIVDHEGWQTVWPDGVSSMRQDVRERIQDDSGRLWERVKKI